MYIGTEREDNFKSREVKRLKECALALKLHVYCGFTYAYALHDLSYHVYTNNIYCRWMDMLDFICMDSAELRGTESNRKTLI